MTEKKIVRTGKKEKKKDDEKNNGRFNSKKIKTIC